mmetsp:Transcript_26802/g.45214  ORF Transcript_26802/g.45214 Transcript_26802/m.45214 type:complete len:245 (+) Transcript_26802:54-788(+)
MNMMHESTPVIALQEIHSHVHQQARPFLSPSSRCCLFLSCIFLGGSTIRVSTVAVDCAHSQQSQHAVALARRSHASHSYSTRQSSSPVYSINPCLHCGCPCQALHTGAFAHGPQRLLHLQQRQATGSHLRLPLSLFLLQIRQLYLRSLHGATQRVDHAHHFFSSLNKLWMHEVLLVRDVVRRGSGRVRRFRLHWELKRLVGAGVPPLQRAEGREHERYLTRRAAECIDIHCNRYVPSSTRARSA